jgi:tryptophanyl-tRNA synthetase
MPTPSPNRKRVLSGMRSTGKLHLGNYVGALQNWVAMQDQYECFFFVADWHALTTDYADTSHVKENSIEVLLDWLAAGLDPERCTMFIQSHVPQHAELHLLFSMITPLGWLERVPTYKEQKENIAEKDLSTYGFLGYPVLQAADILIYKGDFVPVGEDQVPHVELTREIARRFNFFYPKRGYEPAVKLSREDESKAAFNMHIDLAEESLIYSHESTFAKPSRDEGATRSEVVFPEPQPLLTRTPKLPGTDGRKMSKSYGNTIMLADPEPVVREKMRTMVNDPARAHRTDPGNPERCPVGDMHKVFSSLDTINQVYIGCTSAGISCTECKSWAADAIVNLLAPMQQRRKEYEDNPQETLRRLKSSASKAREIAEETMREVRETMGLSQGYEFSLLQASRSEVTAETRLYGPATWFDVHYEDFFNSICQTWLNNLPSNIELRPGDGIRRYYTGSNKRVGLSATREVVDDQYLFMPLDRHDDVLVLLGFPRSCEIIPFVLPQKVLQPNWKKFGREPRKEAKKKGELVRLLVRSQGPDFFLDIPGEEPLPISEFRSNYAPFL